MMWLFDCIREVVLPSDFEIVKRLAPSSAHLACGLNGFFSVVLHLDERGKGRVLVIEKG
ncbi:hypothetical protein [Pseudomonas sp. PAMC 25886]|jgi:hypothetical protein|uniref:hypothetical protein n=1 Tax=Pseudomonas sp. PAMC 25886 TaxID=1125977 RepID=UPI001300C32B|nr:hypothetical protein [Pseudomonas sp. PAMC 25886]